MLRLAKPVLEDPEKLRKVDWSFINWASPLFSRPGSSENVKLFPPDATPLTTLPRTDTGMVFLQWPSHAIKAGNTTDYNFITQSFFGCWRALHLGYAQECNKYLLIIRQFSHFYVRLYYWQDLTLYRMKLHQGILPNRQFTFPR